MTSLGDHSQDEQSVVDNVRELTSPREILALVSQAIDSGKDRNEIFEITRAATTTLNEVGADRSAIEKLWRRVAQAFESDAEIQRLAGSVFQERGKVDEALRAFENAFSALDDAREKSDLAEQMGDLAESAFGSKRAFEFYERSVSVSNTQRSAIRKMTQLLLRDEDYIGALKSIEKEVELFHHLSPKPDGLAAELAELFLAVARALVDDPSQHFTTTNAIDGAIRLAPNVPECTSLKERVRTYGSHWREHVRSLRDAALDVRDKTDAAKHYLSIARITRHYAPDDSKAISQNVDKCILLAPGYWPAWAFLEEIHRQEGSLDEFMTRLETQIKSTRKVDIATQLVVEMSRLQKEQGVSANDQVGLYETLLALDPKNENAIEALCDTLIAADRQAEAAHVLERLRGSGVTLKAEFIETLAKLYERELDEPQKAAAAYGDLFEVNGDAALLNVMVQLYSKVDAHESCAATLEQLLTTPAVQDYPNQRRGALADLLALYRGPLADPDKAYLTVSALFLEEPNAGNRSELERLSGHLNKPKKMAETFELVAERTEDESDARAYRLAAADAFVAARDTKRARAMLDQLLKANAKDAEALQRLDGILAEDGDPEEFAEVLQERLLSQSDVKDKSATLFTLADVYRRLRRFDDEIATLQNIVAIDSINQEALKRLDPLCTQHERHEELLEVLRARARLSEGEEKRILGMREARLLDDLARPVEAADTYLKLHEEAPESLPLLRELERFVQRDIRSVEIAQALQPYYAQVEAWRPHAQMIAIRRDHESERSRRASLSRTLGEVLERRLNSPREAFDAWADALVDAPGDPETLGEVERLAGVAQTHKQFSVLLERAAEGLPDGPQKNDLLARRAGLLNGVLGDQEAALEAHIALLEKSPDHLPTLDAVIKAYEERDAFADLAPLLERRFDLSAADEQASFAARLGLAQYATQQDAARDHLLLALSDADALDASLKERAQNAATDLLRARLSNEANTEDATSLVDLLEASAQTMAGSERAALRAEAGDIQRVHLNDLEQALRSYEAALATYIVSAFAELGARAILENEHANKPLRDSAARLLTGVYEKRGNPAAQAGVLHGLLGYETNPERRRQLVFSLAQLLYGELDCEDDAVSLVLQHLQTDPGDASARQFAEAAALGAGKTNELLVAWESLRDSSDEELSLLYAERLAEMAERAQDHERSASALRYLAERSADDIQVWDRLRAAYDRTDDAEGVYFALSRLAELAPEESQLEKLKALSDFAFELLEDPERGFADLQNAATRSPLDDTIWIRLQERAVEFGRAELLVTVLEKRAEIANSDAERAGLLLQHGQLLLEHIKEPELAVRSLTRSLELERDGRTTAQTGYYLAQIARGEDAAALTALDAIVDHHRAQEAWQPLAESLEIAVDKRPPGEERALLLDEVSQIYEDQLRVPALAFREACRAFRDMPTVERQERITELAAATQSGAELVGVLEDVAEQLVDGDSERALSLYRKIMIMSSALSDTETQARAANAILKLEPHARDALSALESLHRQSTDQQGLIEVLERRVAVTEDVEKRHTTILELAQLLVASDEPQRAEAHLLTVIEEDPRHDDALAALDAFYQSTGNSASHVDILEKRIGFAITPQARSSLQVRLSEVLLKRRGDPALALDALQKAYEEEPASQELRHALESMVEHAKTHGTPAVKDVASVLEQVTRAQEDWSACGKAIETRLSDEDDSSLREELWLELMRIQNQQLERPDFAFIAACNAVQELPGSAAIRENAEGLARDTEMEDTLRDIYEDIADETDDSILAVTLNSVIAEIAEREGDSTAARERLEAAVRSGADDRETLEALVRLSRQSEDKQVLCDALERLALQCMAENDHARASDAYAELSDVYDGEGLAEPALRSARAQLSIDPSDSAARFQVERLLRSSKRFPELLAHLLESAEREEESTARVDCWVRALPVMLEHGENLEDAVHILEQVASFDAHHPQIVVLGARLFERLRAESDTLKGNEQKRVIDLLEPRYSALEEWPQLIVLWRVRLEETTDLDERKTLWRQIAEVCGARLDQPEQAFMALGRALSESPDDMTLRDQAERVSIQIGDVETLVGLYEDIGEAIAQDPPLRAQYAKRCAELYEGSVGDPSRAIAQYELALSLFDDEAPEESVVLERLEKLNRAVANPQGLADTLVRLAKKAQGQEARGFFLEAASIQVAGLSDREAALASLKSAMAIDSQDAHTAKLLAENHSALGHWQEAADALKHELTLLDDDDERVISARFQLGVILDSELDDHDAAAEVFHSVLESSPNHAATRAYLEERMGQGEGVGAQFLEAAYEETGDWAKAIEVMRKQAKELVRGGEEHEAAEKYLRIAEVQEKHLAQPEFAYMTLCSAMEHEVLHERARSEATRLARENDLVEELAEFFEEQGQKAEEQERSNVAAEIREHAAALFANELNDVPRAILAYEAILEKHPGRITPLDALSVYYADEKRFDELESILRRRLMFLDDPKERGPLLVRLAKTLADDLDRSDEAIPILEDARKSEPANQSVRRSLIDLYSESLRIEEARDLLEEDLAEARADGDETQVAHSRRRLAQMLTVQLDSPDDAIPLWEEIKLREPSDESAYNALEALYEKTQNYQALRTLYEERLTHERDPRKVSDVTARLGVVLSTHLGSKEEAVAYHLKVLDLEARNTASLAALRQLYRELEKHEELNALLRRMMRFTTDARVLKGLRFELASLLAEHLGKRAEAIETGRRILDIEPHSKEELLKLVQLFESSEAHEELSGVLEDLANECEGQERVETFTRLGRLYEEKMGRPELAARAYSQVASHSPSDIFSYDRLIHLYEEQGDWNALVTLKKQRHDSIEDSAEKLELLKDIGRIRDEKMGSKDMAFLAACEAFQTRPDDRAVAEWVDRLAIETDSVEEMVAIYDDVLGFVSDEERIVEIHLRMAELSSKYLESPDEAETQYKRVLEYDAVNVAGLQGLFSLYESQERWSDAVAILERKAEAASERVDRVEVLKEIARLHDKRSHDVDGAAGAYRRILELDGRDRDTLKELAELFERYERWQSLINVLEREEALSEVSEESLSLRYRIASVQEQELEQPEVAVATHRAILEDDGRFELSLRALERLYTTLARPKDLVGVFEEVVALEDDNVEKIKYLNKIANTHEEQLDDLDGAIEATERIVSLDAQNELALRTLTRLLKSRSRFERLAEVLEARESLSANTKERVFLLLELGACYHRELSQIDRAEAAYLKAIELDSDSRDAVHALGQLYERSGNWFNALEKLQQEAKLAAGTPEAVELHFRIAKINEEMLLDADAAKAAYEHALTLDEAYLPAIRALKDIAFNESEKQSGDERTQAQEEYLAWLKAEAKHSVEDEEKTALYTQAGLYLQDEVADLEGAASAYEEALAVSADHLAAAKPLSEICLRNESFERAEQLLDIVTANNDDDDASVACRQHYRLGYVCERLGKEQKALKHYQRAYELEPTYLEGLEGLGQALFRAELWADAEKIYNAILIHHRDSLTDAEVVDYYHQLATLSHKLEKRERAIKHLTKALDLDSTHGPSLRLLADVQGDDGDHEETYEALMRLVPVRNGDARVDLLIEIGELSRDKLEDAYRAIDAFDDANRQRPGDKRILESLLELYRETKQGAHSVEVLEELVRIEPDEKARVRLNHTLGEVYRDELKNETRAVQYFNAALDLDPTYITSFQATEQLLSANKNWRLLEENYIAMLKRVAPSQTKVKRELWKNLAGLYRYRLKNFEGAAQAYRVLHKLEPQNAEVLESLADLLANSPQAIDESIGAYQKLLTLTPDAPQRTLHALVRLYHNRRQVDRAYVSCGALRVLGDMVPEEEKLYLHYRRQQPSLPRASLTQAVWDAQVIHPLAKNPIADISYVLWRAASQVLVRSEKDLGLEKARQWTRQPLDNPVPTFFVTQLRRVRDVLALGAFELYVKKSAADALQILPTQRPSLAVGDANEVFREIPEAQLRFLCARRVAYFYPSFVLPSVVGAQAFQGLIEAAVKIVEPRYRPQMDTKDYERRLSRVAGALKGPLQKPVQALIERDSALPIREFLTGMEHTTVRAAYVMTGDLELCAHLLRQPDPGPLPLPYADKIRSLLTYAVSDDYLDLRSGLGMAIKG